MLRLSAGLSTSFSPAPSAAPRCFTSFRSQSLAFWSVNVALADAFNTLVCTHWLTDWHTLHPLSFWDNVKQIWPQKELKQAPLSSDPTPSVTPSPPHSHPSPLGTVCMEKTAIRYGADPNKKASVFKRGRQTPALIVHSSDKLQTGHCVKAELFDSPENVTSAASTTTFPAVSNVRLNATPVWCLPKKISSLWNNIVHDNSDFLSCMWGEKKRCWSARINARRWLRIGFLCVE